MQAVRATEWRASTLDDQCGTVREPFRILFSRFDYASDALSNETAAPRREARAARAGPHLLPVGSPTTGYDVGRTRSDHVRG